MAGAGIGRLSTDEAFLRTGILIDMCGAPRRKAGIARAPAWCDELEARDLSAAERGQLDYFRANAWNTRRPRRRNGDFWLWDQAALQQEVFFLVNRPRARNIFLHRAGKDASAAVETMASFPLAQCSQRNRYHRRSTRPYSRAARDQSFGDHRRRRLPPYRLVSQRRAGTCIPRGWVRRVSR
jgi:hypothetical protein